jgi:PAP2 superfamily
LIIGRSGIGLVHRHPAQIPSAIFIVLVIAYTAIAPNFDQIFISYAFASATIFLFVAGSASGSWIATVIAALAFSLCHAFFQQGGTIAAPSLHLYAGMLGRGSLAALGWRAVWASPEESRRLFRISLLPVGIVLFVLASLLFLNLTALTRSPVLDPYLYLFDGSLGFQPSFLLGQFFARCKLIAEFAQVTYFSLPFAIALACAGYLKYGAPWRPLAVLTSAGVLGYLLYWVFPAAGPLYLAGPSFPNFPHAFDALVQMHPHPVVLPVRAARNAMPSLHMAWALLLWFNSRPFSRVARALALSYVLVTIVDTLGTGEHYLVDLAVALPFSVAVQALWSPVRTSTRAAVLASATVLTLTWLWMLRYAASFFLRSPAISWGCLIGSTMASLLLARFLRTGGETPVAEKL